MASGFGLLSRLTFLQDGLSAVLARVNPAVVHNVEKYRAISKVMYLSLLEQRGGAYLEFGVYQGSSFTHAIRAYRAMRHLGSPTSPMRFYGFDSFSGFGELAPDDEHPFYVDHNFAVDLATVEKRVRRAARDVPFELVPGFFEESLAAGPAALGISHAAIVFIDSDTYTSAHAALAFCLPVVQAGTYVILDDYFSYQGRDDRGVRRAFREFVEAGNLHTRQLLTYGMGGVVFVISDAEP